MILHGGFSHPAAVRTTAALAPSNGHGPLAPMFFDANVEPMVTSKTPPPGKDILAASANNLYVDVTMDDLKGFAERYPLNSRLVKRDGRLVEEVYKVDGKYADQIGHRRSGDEETGCRFGKAE